MHSVHSCIFIDTRWILYNCTHLILLIICPLLIYLTAYLPGYTRGNYMYMYLHTNWYAILNSSARKVNFNSNNKKCNPKNLQYHSFISIPLSFIKIFPLEKLFSKVLISLWCSQTLISLPLCPELGSSVQCYEILLSPW